MRLSKVYLPAKDAEGICVAVGSLDCPIRISALLPKLIVAIFVLDIVAEIIRLGSFLRI